ncbi:MAG: baseplate J/gp47 family protein [Deltaproteobacteria bacterium]|nr:baseplate J/gp47 family protein [Deltaproteobacteria bacterium]
MKLFDDIDVNFRSIVERITDSMIQSGLISDTETGSVAKLMAESFAREMAVFYAILEKSHEAGYLETAQGKALDNVVAILGMERAKGDLLRGQVVFSRRTPALQDIGIPAGTRVTGPAIDGKALPLLETVEPARIGKGQRSVNITVQEIPNEREHDFDSLSPGNLSILPRPLMGVENVSNRDPITCSGKPENDDHLRVRASAILRQGQRGTVEAIEAALKGLGIETVKVVESPGGLSGYIEIHLDDPQMRQNPDREVAVRQAIRDVKAAGISVELKFLQTIYCQPVITITPADDDMAEDAFEQLSEKLKEDITRFINGTAPGAVLSKTKLNAIVVSHQDVSEVVHMEMKALVIEFNAAGDEKLVWKKDGWQIDELENTTIDNDRWPVMVVRKWPLRAVINLTMTAPQDKEKGQTKALLQKSVRQITDDYINTIIPTRKVVFNDLQSLLARHIKGLVLEPTWIIHQCDGSVEELNEEHAVSLENGEKLIVDRIDVTIK